MAAAALPARKTYSPRRLARMLLSRPDNLKAKHHDLLALTLTPAPSRLDAQVCER